MNIESRSAFKLTQDEWYPAFKLDGSHRGAKNPWLVEVSHIRYEDGTSRVCVWGADDHGLERDFPTGETDKSLAMFLDVLDQKYVNHGYLKNTLGFVSA